MSEQLNGKSLKEWSLIILITSLAITFCMVGIGFAMAVISNPDAITLSGSFDISQLVGILIGVAMVSTVLVAQQLTSKQVTNAIAQTDDVWSKNP